MLEQLKYVNHLGETIEFGKKGIFVNANDLRDYEWIYDSSRSRAENFRRGVVTKTIPVVISAESRKKCIDTKNRIYEICEKDIISEQKGKLYVGDYYLNCYVFSSTKSNYLDTSITANLSLKIVADGSRWIREDTYYFRGDSGDFVDGKGYEYDYEYDYGLTANHIGAIDIDSIGSCDFVLSIYAGAVDPVIKVDDDCYAIRCTIGAGEKLIVDSSTYSITLVKADGQRENMFRYRDTQSDVFRKISSGKHLIMWNGDYNFELNIIHERGEPAWK